MPENSDDQTKRTSNSLTLAVDVGSKLIQSAALLLGTYLALNEFVLKRGNNELDRSRLSLQIASDAFSEKNEASREKIVDLRDEVLKIPVDKYNDKSARKIVEDKYFLAIRGISRFYQTVLGCIDALACDERILQSILCADAEKQYELIGEIKSRAGGCGPYGCVGDKVLGGGDKILGVDRMAPTIERFARSCTKQASG